MSWFWFSIIALLCWSGSDFFSKIGCREASDKYSQYKMVMAVEAIRKAGEYFGFRCPLDGEAKVGNSWYDTH